MSSPPEAGVESDGFSDFLPDSFGLPVEPVVSRRTSSRSGSVLSLALEPELLRGVPVDVALSGWCQHWSDSTKVTSLAYAHQLSRPVDSIDTFLSHDWGTSRWKKLATLLMVFNSRAAFVACFLVSVLTSILRVVQILPNELWTAGFGHIAFLVVLGFWQRIRRRFCGQPMVFLDRLCINQTDPEAKQKGILGLGAFVLRSKKMLVLWSPQYFTRLWCTYEIGCFLSHRGRINDIEILPVKASLILFLTAILWHALMIGYHIAMETVREGFGTKSLMAFLIPTIAMCSFAAFLLPAVNYLGMSMMKEVDQLPRQLANFQVQEAQCFCCSNNHKHPQTGQEMICDRELVYESLEDLYSGRPGASDYLKEFNSRVHERLGPKVFSRMGVGFPLKYAVYVIMASNMAFLTELIAVLQKGPSASLDGLDYGIWTLRETLRWVQPFLAMLFAQQFSVLIWKRFNFKSSLCLSICLSPVVTLGVASTWISMEVVLWLTPDQSMLAILPFLAVSVLDLYLYRDFFSTHPLRAASESGRETPPSTDAGDASVAIERLNSLNLAAFDKWEIEEDGDTLVSWKF